MNELLLALVLGATALSNFPREAGGRVSQQAIGITLAGAPAVVVPAGEKVIALRGDGSMVLGFPLSLGAGEAASGPAAAGDMDGDGRPEIAVVTTSGRLFLWSGGLVAGFPRILGAGARAGASFADVDGDGRPEVLVGDEKGRVHAFKRSGREAAPSYKDLSLTPAPPRALSWQRNGTTQPLAESSQEVPPRLVKAGDRWRCIVTPTDGSEDGPLAGTEEAVVQAAPEPEQGIAQPAAVRPIVRPLR